MRRNTSSGLAFDTQSTKAVHASVLLAQFNTLRDEIKTRSTAQAALLTANITAIGVIGGFVFSDKLDFGHFEEESFASQ
jgi:hypothetical protein